MVKGMTTGQGIEKKTKPNRTDGKKNRHFLRQRFPYHCNHQITIGPLWYGSATGHYSWKNSDIRLV